MQETVLYKTGDVEVIAVPYDGPRGDRLRIKVGAEGRDLLEGPARQIHLAIRGWIRRQKQLRGDTPRGRAKFEKRQEAYHGAAAR